ncbi:MAG TPA: threonine synthase [Thermodesulfobacteriota bacterium]|nr:threonine synthase [Thermodesulfobacteriota bacterium]
MENGLFCGKCGRTFPLDETIWKCSCGGLLDVRFEASFPIEKIRKRKPVMWRYREAVPLARDENIVSFDEGYTPLVPVDFPGMKVLLKQDHLFPTGSYKDRGASVLMSKVKELGIAKVVEDSSGNAGCAIAAYGAAAGIETRIFVPGNTSPAKLAQIEAYGAALTRVPGSREDTARAVWEAAAKDYYASHSWNPFFFHGTKTWAFEVWEQLGWAAPDTVILPAGNGTLVIGAYLGFNELADAGMLRKVPRIVAVQSASCDPLTRAFRGASGRAFSGDTLAEGIAIAEPVRKQQIVDAVRNTGGTFISVDDAEIKKSLRWMWEKGFYIEPTAAAAVAAIFRYLKDSDSEEQIVSVLTGHGLKSTEKALKILEGGPIGDRSLHPSGHDVP